jgi:membrane protein implicated in regulation of membrane protease activity
VSSINGLLFNWAIALGALALGGTLYAIIAFLAVALVRVAIDAQALRRDNEELRYMLEQRNRQLGIEAAVFDPEAPPESTTRLSRGVIETRAAAR